MLKYGKTHGKNNIFNAISVMFLDFFWWHSTDSDGARLALNPACGLPTQRTWDLGKAKDGNQQQQEQQEQHQLCKTANPCEWSLDTAGLKKESMPRPNLAQLTHANAFFTTWPMNWVAYQPIGHGFHVVLKGSHHPLSVQESNWLIMRWKDRGELGRTVLHNRIKCMGFCRGHHI